MLLRSTPHEVSMVLNMFEVVNSTECGLPYMHLVHVYHYTHI